MQYKTEAKHTASGRIGQERVTWAQWEALDFYSKLGAECFVLISLNFRTFYRVPWPVWRDINDIFGKKSVNSVDLEPYKLRDIMHFLDELI